MKPSLTKCRYLRFSLHIILNYKNKYIRPLSLPLFFSFVFEIREKKRIKLFIPILPFNQQSIQKN